MTFKPLELQDCQNIMKTFERAAAFCVTEESVFAMMTPILTGVRAQSAALYNQINAGDVAAVAKTSEEMLRETQEGAANALGNTTSPINLGNLTKSDEEEEGFLTEIRGNFFPADGQGSEQGNAAAIAGGIFNSECIPCGQRLNMLGELNLGKVENYGKEFLTRWMEWLMSQLNMLQDLLGIFTNTDNFIDLCSLLKWLNDYICIPDLQRILSVLMALMSRVSLEFGGILDIMLGLVGPLLTPILSGFIDLLESYILLIVRPIECIINSIQDMIRKLDYNVLFQNIDSLDRHISLGSSAPVGVNIKVPYVGTEIKFETPATGTFSEDYNLLGPAGRALQAENAKEQEVVETAAEELRRIRGASSSVDMKDAGAVERYNQQKQAAEDKYREAIDKQSLSALGRANKSIDRTVDNMKSALYTMLGYLREAAATIEGFFQDIFDELKKIQGAYVGGGGTFVDQLIKKMGLVKMIALVSAIIGAASGGLKCGEDGEDFKVEAIIPTDKAMQVWTDVQGMIHIEEDDKHYQEAMNAMVEAIGATPQVTSIETVKQKDRGQVPDSSNSMQKLKSLIEFTGDPIIDTQIARTTDTLVTRLNATFKCPLQTSTKDAEQINQWILELNS